MKNSLHGLGLLYGIHIYGKRYSNIQFFWNSKLCHEPSVNLSTANQFPTLFRIDKKRLFTLIWFRSPLSCLVLLILKRTKKTSLMIKVILTNITLIVNEWQHSNFRKALTCNFTQLLASSALSSMITSYRVTYWQRAVKHLQERNNDVSVYLLENRPFKITKLCKKKIFRSNLYIWIFLKNCSHVTAVSLIHLRFKKKNHSRVVSALPFTVCLNK